MIILHVNVVYPVGSTGKIVNDIVSCMGVEHSIVCYGRGKNITQNRVVKFCTELEAKVQGLRNRLGGLQYGGNYFATKRLKNLILNEKPDIVHLHCINGYCVNLYQLLDFLAKNNFKTVITHHAEFYYTGSCGHALDCNKWTLEEGCGNCPQKRGATGCLFKDNTSLAWDLLKRSFAKFKKSNLRFVAVSPWVKDRSMLSPIVNQFACDVVMNGLNTNIFKWKKDGTKFQQISDNEIVCLHVTASFETKRNTLKGGQYIIELARLNPTYKFIVASMHTDVTEELPANIILWGRTKDQEELARLYRRANITIITSKRETFSMIVAESLCCGTPIVGFEAGGPESITIPEYSRFVEQGNINAFQEAMVEILNKKLDSSEISKSGHSKYSKEIMVSNYLNLYKDLLDS